MNNDLVLCANGKRYHVVMGVTITQEFNETLDSASVILDNVSKEDRLNIKPYDFVRLKNVGDGFPLDEEFLVDDFVETETNISQHIYHYVINLMSETKLLEKMQLPNIAITHSKRFGKKSIATKLSDYCDLGVKKVKMVGESLHWAYKPILTWDFTKDEAFKDECADMAMQAPTLRQALTDLMLQKGRIPKVEERKIGWLDFNAKPTAFDITAKGMNKIQRSNSSDSYVNTLVSMNDQLLDTGNEVISETLGFRDAENVFLQQKANLKLHTAFPIYNVTKCVVTAPVTFSKRVYVRSTHMNEEGQWYPNLTIRALDRDGKEVTAPTSLVRTLILHYEATKAVTLRSAKFIVSEERKPSISGWDYKATNVFVQEREIPVGTTEISFDIAENGLNYEQCLEFDSVIVDGERSIHQGTRLFGIGDAYELSYEKMWNKEFLLGATADDFGYYSIDMTPNVVENTKRQLLDTDFSTMPSQASAEELAKWVYGTVGYSIGGQEISGFSQTYERAQGWWDVTKTYIENIANCLLPVSHTANVSYTKFKQSTIDAWRKFLGGYEGDFDISPNGYYKNTFATFLFDISYQPLNNLTLKSYKDDTALQLEQLDNTAQGLTDMDRFALNQSEKVDRLGNEVLSINQTTDDYKSLQPLNSKWEGNIVFKRTISINKNYVQVSYALSKDYVIKNYFTSVATKYRAYEHVDYKQSTLRKIHENVFATLDAEKHSNETDLLPTEDALKFFYGLLPYQGDARFRYALERSNDMVVKYDLSVVTTRNAILFVHESWFSIGNGSYLTSLDPTNGGLPQSYQIWDDDYAESHELGYTANIAFYDENTDEGLLSVQKEPLVDKKNMANALCLRAEKTHKDESERLNTTLQITYAVKDDDLALYEEAIRNMPYADNSQYGHANAIVVYPTKQDALQDNNGVLMTTGEEGDILVTDLVEADETAKALTFKTLSDFLGTQLFMGFKYAIAHAYKDGDNWKWKRIATYLGDETKTYYAYLNDTDTQLVYAEDKDKVLRPLYKDNGRGLRYYEDAL